MENICQPSDATPFEDLLDYVTGEKAQHAKADSIERGLFKMLLSLGAKLLQLFFVMRSQTCSRAAFQDKDGQMLPYHHDSGRVYFSIFGKVSIERAYFYKPGAGGQTPLDADLGLGDDSYPDLVREVTEYFAIYILSGKIAQVISELRTLAQAKKMKVAQRKQLTKTANYFERNLPYMDYQTDLANGYPIASGVIEGACRHFVKDRFELSGMRWLQTSAENLLRLRAVAENADWDKYFAFHREQRQLRLHGQPASNTYSIESHVINSQPEVLRQPNTVIGHSKRYSLPLAV